MASVTRRVRPQGTLSSWIYCFAALLATLVLTRAVTSLAQESNLPSAPPVVTIDGQFSPPPGVETPATADAATPVSGTPIAIGSLFDILVQGGWLMIPLAVCSFVLTVFTLERLFSLRRGRVIPRPFVKRFLHQLKDGALDKETALKLCLENKSPVASVFAHAVRKWGRPAVEVEQAVLDGGERTVNNLRRYLRVINGVATVSPLLGLLGTVTGMIEAFNAIATTQAMGRPELLAGGISEALLTTAAGLSVAIPALIFYMFFVSKVDRLIIEIDALGQEVVHLISAEAMVRPQRTMSRTKEAA